MKQPLSFFSIKTQFENVGDALINREMIKLAAANGEAHVDLSRCPDTFKETLGINDIAFVYDSFLSLCVSMIKHKLSGKDCYYFLSPGGYVGEISNKDVMAKLINTAVLYMFFLFGIKICLVGVSYERLGPRNLFFQKLRAKILYRHLVRDRDSKTFAKNNGIAVNGVIPDLAFNIFTSTAEVKQKRDAKTVAFSFRTDQYSEQKKELTQVVQAIIDAMPDNTTYAIVVQVDRDKEGLQEIKSFIEKKIGKPVTTTAGSHSVDVCLEAYKQCDIIISNRLHALLVGASTTKRLIAVTGRGKNRKIEGILKEINCERLEISASDFEPERIKDVLNIAFKQVADCTDKRAALHDVFEELLKS